MKTATDVAALRSSRADAFGVKIGSKLAAQARKTCHNKKTPSRQSPNEVLQIT